MSFTPAEVRNVRLKRGPWGYRKSHVDHLLVEIADSFELCWRERADLTEKVERLEVELAHSGELESLLRSTVSSAERSARDVKDKAQHEAEVILAEARAQALTIATSTVAENQRLKAESRRIRALLQAALDTVDEAEPKEEAEPTEADEKEPESAAELELGEPLEAPIDFPSRG
jgi:cell division initiation protein